MDSSVLLLVLVAVMLGIVGLVVLAKKLGLAGPGEANEENLPYQLRDELLSKAEAAFYGPLQMALPRATTLLKWQRVPLVFAKVRLADVLWVGRVERREGERSHASWRNKLTQKHVDFLICHPETTKPLLLVELDDASHQRRDRQERDAFVDRACAAAGVPILHVRCMQRYVVEELAQQIAGKMG